MAFTATIPPAKLWNTWEKQLPWLLVVFFVLVNLSWMARDTAPWPVIDSYTEAEQTLEVIERGLPSSPAEAEKCPKTLTDGGRPPLYQILAIPEVLLFGSSEDAFASVNLLLLAILLLATFHLTLELTRSPAAGALAVTILGCFPPLIRLVPMFRLHFGGITFGAVAVWLLLRTCRSHRVRDAWLAGISTAAAVLMHPVAVWVVSLPMVTTWLATFHWSWNKTRDTQEGNFRSRLRRCCCNRTVILGLFPAGFLAVTLVAGWFLTLGHPLLRFAARLRQDWLFSFRGMNEVSWPPHQSAKGGFWYLVNAPTAISSPLLIALAAAVIGILWKGSGRQRILVVWLLAAYALIGRLGTLCWKYGAYGLPLAAAIIAIGSTIPSRRRWRVLGASIVVIVSLVNLGITIQGQPRLSGPLGRYWGARSWRSAQLGPRPPRDGHWPFAEVVSKLLSEHPHLPRTEVFVGPAPLAPPFGFARARFWPTGQIRFRQAGAPYWGQGFQMERLLRSHWIIETRPLTRWKRSQCIYQRAVAFFLQSPPAEFVSSHRREERFDLPTGGWLVLLHRTSPLTLAEIDSSMAALDLAPKYLTSGHLLAASLLAEEGRFAEALARLEKASAVKEQPPRMRARLLTESAALLLGGHRTAAAREKLRQALEAAPDNQRARKLLQGLDRRGEK